MTIHAPVRPGHPGILTAGIGSLGDAKGLLGLGLPFVLLAAGMWTFADLRPELGLHGRGMATAIDGCFAWLALAWQRRVLIGREAGEGMLGWSRDLPQPRFLAYLLWAVVLTTALTIPGSVIGAAVFLAVGLDNASALPVIMATTLAVAGVLLLMTGRLLFLFPPLAIGRSSRPAKAWREARGHGLRLGFAILLLGVAGAALALAPTFALPASLLESPAALAAMNLWIALVRTTMVLIGAAGVALLWRSVAVLPGAALVGRHEPVIVPDRLGTSG